MDKELLMDAMRLSSELRKDMKELTKLWSLRLFEDLHSASSFNETMGLNYEETQLRFEMLEKAVREEDFATIANGEWPIYSLVNYYDHLMDLIKKSRVSSEKKDGYLRSIRKWKNTAGLYAQLVCQMEDDS